MAHLVPSIRPLAMARSSAASIDPGTYQPASARRDVLIGAE